MSSSSSGPRRPSFWDALLPSCTPDVCTAALDLPNEFPPLQDGDGEDCSAGAGLSLFGDGSAGGASSAGVTYEQYMSRRPDTIGYPPDKAASGAGGRALAGGGAPAPGDKLDDRKIAALQAQVYMLKQQLKMKDVQLSRARRARNGEGADEDDDAAAAAAAATAAAAAAAGGIYADGAVGVAARDAGVMDGRMVPDGAMRPLAVELADEVEFADEGADPEEDTDSVRAALATRGLTEA